MPVIPWNLTGTEPQKSIVRQAFERIKFPFEVLALPGTPELGWRDLNGSDEWWLAEGGTARKHEGHGTPAPDGERPEPLNGELEGRKWVMGVFFPSSARIYLDVRLEPYPELAMSVVSAEIAHAVDEFLPLSEEQRQAIMAILHPEGADHHTWWERSDYNAEYYTLVGEEFMRLFTKAYSDIPFGDSSAFAHGHVQVDPKAVRQIIGIERTDAPPEPAPATHTHTYVRYGKSKIVHKPTHYDNKVPTETIEAEHIPAGYRACKVCKPH